MCESGLDILTILNLCARKNIILGTSLFRPNIEKYDRSLTDYPNRGHLFREARVTDVSEMRKLGRPISLILYNG